MASRIRHITAERYHKHGTFRSRDSTEIIHASCGDEIKKGWFSFPSTHAFGVAEAVQLAHALDQLPASLTIYGIEGKHFSVGIGLSPEVEQATQGVVEQMIQEVRGSL